MIHILGKLIHNLFLFYIYSIYLFCHTNKVPTGSHTNSGRCFANTGKLKTCSKRMVALQASIGNKILNWEWDINVYLNNSETIFTISLSMFSFLIRMIFRQIHCMKMSMSTYIIKILCSHMNNNVVSISLIVWK